MSKPPEYWLFAHRNSRTPPRDERTARIAAFRSSVGDVEFEVLETAEDEAPAVAQ
jgi:hypothetical protein